jgi:molybdopterin-containing oxidoreductase family membrane subunit
MIVCNALIPQIFWAPRARRNLLLLWIATLFINVGMWAERFVIIVIGLSRDYLPSTWDIFRPTWVDLGIFTGTLGFFSLLFLLFIKYVPFVPAAELRELRHELHEGGGHG